MAKAKKIVRREWTKDDVRQMKSMAKARAGVKKISKSLKRTQGANFSPSGLNAASYKRRARLRSLYDRQGWRRALHHQS
jgi:hypothetical protein